MQAVMRASSFSLDRRADRIYKLVSIIAATTEGK